MSCSWLYTEVLQQKPYFPFFEGGRNLRKITTDANTKLYFNYVITIMRVAFALRGWNRWQRLHFTTLIKTTLVSAVSGALFSSSMASMDTCSKGETVPNAFGISPPP